MARSPSSQPPDSPALDTGLADTSEVSQPQETSAATSPRVRLPDYHPITPPHFHWGPVDSEGFSLSLDVAYQEEIVHWKKNSFDVPHGLVGKRFVAELARVIPCCR